MSAGGNTPPPEGLPPRAPLMHNETSGIAIGFDETLRLKNCRYVVDAVHPKCGAVFLFYCAPKEVSLSAFYVALCDERSRNKKGPVAKKTLDVVRRIEEIVMQKKVIRDERYTLLGSAPGSRSTSCSSVGPDAHGGEGDHDEQPWMEVLLALCDEATGATIGDDVHSFTQECKRLSHDPEDVRRLYQWTVCSSGILPLHLSLRQLEFTTRTTDNSETMMMNEDEFFVAYCDPLLLPSRRPVVNRRTESVVSAASSEATLEGNIVQGGAAAPPGTPAKRLSTHQDAGDVLSPMTPAAAASSPFTTARDDTAAAFAAYFERADRVMSITGRGVRTPPPIYRSPNVSSPVPNKASGTSHHHAATLNFSPRGAATQLGSSSHLKPRKWDSTYL